MDEIRSHTFVVSPRSRGLTLTVRVMGDLGKEPLHREYYVGLTYGEVLDVIEATATRWPLGAVVWDDGSTQTQIDFS